MIPDIVPRHCCWGASQKSQASSRTQLVVRPLKQVVDVKKSRARLRLIPYVDYNDVDVPQTVTELPLSTS